VASRLIVLAVTCLWWLPADAIIFEVRRNSNIFEEPDSSSTQLDRIEATTSSTIDAQLVGFEQENDFYRIIVPDTGEIGWIHKGRGRLRAGEARDTVSAFDRNTYNHWIDADGDCQTTRHEVLIRDSQIGVDFRDSSECKVDSGAWIDPYTGNTITDARDIDIDHMVPLLNTHMSGGWNWTPERREEYANFMDDSDHLVSVLDSENQAKGGKGPDEYMPTNEDFHCEYVENWIRIKRDWGLRMTVNEAEATFRIHFDCL